VDTELGAFTGALLAHRAAHRAAIIREAREGLGGGPRVSFYGRAPMYSLSDRASIPDVTPLPAAAGEGWPRAKSD
jgi:hypothetical protein